MARNSGEVIYESLAEERRGEEDSQVSYSLWQLFSLSFLFSKNEDLLHK
jgi:hypothetical protein